MVLVAVGVRGRRSDGWRVTSPVIERAGAGAEGWMRLGVGDVHLPLPGGGVG